MTKKYMLTIPRTVSKRAIKEMIGQNDCKRWIVGRETGRGGYAHWQIRLETSNQTFFEWVKRNIPSAHIEECNDVWDYERKEGDYWTSDDTVEVRKLRFGTMTKAQKGALRALCDTNDRQVVFWYDPRGNRGKSWLCGHLWEKGLAHYVPPYLSSVKELIQTVASMQMASRRPIVVIDIPRSWKWSTELYTAIESIKDGLIMDTRYHARTINIRGT